MLFMIPLILLAKLYPAAALAERFLSCELIEKVLGKISGQCAFSTPSQRKGNEVAETSNLTL